MASTPRHYIVDAAVLPEVFRKVVEAQRLMEQGECETVNDAVRQVGISRSAFYKYKSSVRPFNDMLHGRIVTLQFVLRDSPGALSFILHILAVSGTNILTINQAIPSNGCAAVTVVVETTEMGRSMEELLASLQQSPQVIRVEIPAG